jgi:2-succinyl-5-enolpyruvyl-6-hydroxy-3-cyclohexene-1-carboxylate synthase
MSDGTERATQATFCATLVDEWARAGVRHAVVAPGSRSTPLALALTADGRLRTHVFHDERAAAFAALGIALASGQPPVLLCTSGTATTHFHAAVVEADLAGTPLLVCTADRPPELRDVGAPQAIDQRDLYGRAVRWFVDPGVADEAMRGAWRAIAAQAYLAATGRPPGPVHLNLPFREPLVGEPMELPPGRDGGAPWTTRPPEPREPIDLSADRLLVVGRGGGAAPTIADVTAGLAGRDVIEHGDLILRHAPTAARLRPDVIVRIGRSPASRVVNEWLAVTGATEHVHIDRWSDPSRTASVFGGGSDLTRLVSGDGYRAAWRAADDAAEAAIAETLGGFDTLTEPAAARAVIGALPPGAQLVVASSMPIRDVEWFAPRRSDITVHANRGANGIDGTIASGIGVALASGRPTAVLLGDLAFLHDSTALIAVRQRAVDLTLVVIDNDGGGIFSFLPQAGTLEAERFEQLFGTPHGVRPEELAAAHGIASVTVEDPEALEPAIRSTMAATGVWLVVVRTDRGANVKAHEALSAAVARALSAG